MDEISKHALDLSANEYGNYVVQHVLKNGAPEYKKQVIDALIGHVLGLSRHKFARYVLSCSPCSAHLVAPYSTVGARVDRTRDRKRRVRCAHMGDEGME